MIRGTILFWIGVITLALATRSGNADWFITNPQDPTQTAATIAASGGGPTTSTAPIGLFKWNGSQFNSWGYGDPSPVETDDVVGDWASTLHPEMGISQINPGEYRVYLNWNQSGQVFKYFQVQ
jgi:hypothetical protein